MNEEKNLKAEGNRRKVIAWNKRDNNDGEASPNDKKSSVFFWPVIMGIGALIFIFLLILLTNLPQKNSITPLSQKDNDSKKQNSSSKEAKMRQGFYALSQGDKEKALEIFRELVASAPENASFQRGLKRAETIDQVYPILQKAAEQEAEERLDEALRNYQQAFAIDPLSAQAQQGQSRVESQMNKEKFAALMEETKKLAANKDWEGALAKYQIMQELASPADKEALNKAIAEAYRQQKMHNVEPLLEKARERETVFNWSGAREAYTSILKFSPQNAEAKAGLLRVGEIERALILYRKSLADAFKYSNNGRFPKAVIAFNKAMEKKPSYLVLTDEVRTLQKTLKEQSMPVTLSLISNNRTFVSIQGIKPIGYFKKTEVTLLPDIYVIKGQRSGYKEVSIELTIRAGKAIGPLTIIATEKTP